MLYSTHIYTQCRLWFEQTWKNYSTILTQSLWELDVGVWRFGRLNWWLVVFFSVVIVVVRCWFEWLAGWINKFRGLYSKSNETQTRTQTHAQTNCTTNPVALNVPNVASVLRFFSSFFCQFFFLSFVNNYVRSTVRSINEWIWMWGKSLHWMVTLLNWC